MLTDERLEEAIGLTTRQRIALTYNELHEVLRELVERRRAEAVGGAGAEEVMGQGVSYCPMWGMTIEEAAKRAVNLRDRLESHVWLIFNERAISVGYKAEWSKVVTAYHAAWGRAGRRHG